MDTGGEAAAKRVLAEKLPFFTKAVNFHSKSEEVMHLNPIFEPGTYFLFRGYQDLAVFLFTWLVLCSLVPALARGLQDFVCKRGFTLPLCGRWVSQFKRTRVKWPTPIVASWQDIHVYTYICYIISKDIYNIDIDYIYIIYRYRLYI